MSEQCREANGLFVKLKVKMKKEKILKCMAEAKRVNRQYSKDLLSKDENKVAEGKRIVDLNVLGNRLQCNNCKEVLSLKNITKEHRGGLLSKLSIKCLKCEMINNVSTGNTQIVNKLAYNDETLGVVLGKFYLLTLIFVFNVIIYIKI